MLPAAASSGATLTRLPTLTAINSASVSRQRRNRSSTGSDVPETDPGRRMRSIFAEKDLTERRPEVWIEYGVDDRIE